MLRTLLVCLIALSFLTAAFVDDKIDKAAIEKTSAAVRAAFARGEILAILSYHHPDVTKALAYNRYLVGPARWRQTSVPLSRTTAWNSYKMTLRF